MKFIEKKVKNCVTRFSFIKLIEGRGKFFLISAFDNLTPINLPIFFFTKLKLKYEVIRITKDKESQITLFKSMRPEYEGLIEFFSIGV